MHAACVLALLAPLPPLAVAQDADCPPASCGNLSIRYPFWLHGQQPSYCGYPSFGIDCDPAGGAPPLLSDSFLRVLDIQYGNSSLVAFHANLADERRHHVRLPRHQVQHVRRHRTVAANHQPCQLGALHLRQLRAAASRQVASDELHGLLWRLQRRTVVLVPEPRRIWRGQSGDCGGGVPVLGRAGDARVGAEGAGRLWKAREKWVPAGVEGARGLPGVRGEPRAVSV
ncbi:unnamed protein product [Urochloa humidicola]